VKKNKRERYQFKKQSKNELYHFFLSIQTTTDGVGGLNFRAFREEK